MHELFDIRMTSANKKHLDINKTLEPEIEINLSRESDIIYHLIMNDVYEPEKHYLYLSPLMTRRIAEIISEEPFFSISLKTTPEGHKLRGKESDIKKLFSKLKERI